jgi:hypothetical protein
MIPMRTAKPKPSSSQVKREKPAATATEHPQATSAPARIHGLPGTPAERAARRCGLMDEHRETLRRLGE